MKLYQYPNCSTCRKAIKFLQAKGIEFESIDITKTPPSLDELKFMLVQLQQQQPQLKQGQERNKLFNTSGVQYRELDMKTRLPDMTDDEALTLLSQNGKLIKRPFLVTNDFGLIGFKEDVWQTKF